MDRGVNYASGISESNPLSSSRSSLLLCPPFSRYKKVKIWNIWSCTADLKVPQKDGSASQRSLTVLLHSSNNIQKDVKRNSSLLEFITSLNLRSKNTVILASHLLIERHCLFAHENHLIGSAKCHALVHSN